jgi:nucleotide-binding universal stress UspA family protein
MPAEEGVRDKSPETIRANTMKILLAMDTSPASEAALEEVAGRPWPAGSSFEVVSVVEPSHLWTASEVAQEAARGAQEVVRKAVERLRSATWAAAGTALSGDPKTVILDRARSSAADFVVVGSHGVSALTRFLLGNVAANVLRYAPCSVEVVRARKGKGGAGMKVLLPTDGSEYSTFAARSIAERPWPSGTEIRVLSAVELILPATRALLEPPFVDSAFIESARADAMKRSQNAIAGSREILSTTGLSVSETISVLLDPPKAIILDEAARWEADLIVLGSHGRRGVDRFLLGSVSEAVAMHAGCSVDVVRKTG